MFDLWPSENVFRDSFFVPDVVSLETSEYLGLTWLTGRKFASNYFDPVQFCK